MANSTVLLKYSSSSPLVYFWHSQDNSESAPRSFISSLFASVHYFTMSSRGFKLKLLLASKWTVQRLCISRCCALLSGHSQSTLLSSCSSWESVRRWAAWPL